MSRDTNVAQLGDVELGLSQQEYNQKATWRAEIRTVDAVALAVAPFAVA